MSMKKKKSLKVFRSLLAFILVLSMLTPFTTSVKADQANPFKTGPQSESILEMKAAIAEQLNLVNGGPILHKDLIGLSGDEQVNVIVHLSETPVALQQGIEKLAGKNLTAAQEETVLKKVNAQQTSVKKEMKALQVSYEEGYSFNTVLNGFAAKVKAADLQKLLELNGVTLVEPDATVYAFEEDVEDATEGETEEDITEEKTEVTESVEVVSPVDGKVDAFMDSSIGFLGIDALWAEGIEGQGIKVAVLDTGIDADHPDFQGIYKGGKNFVPHTGTDYARTRADNDASETSPLDRPASKPEFNANGSSFYTSHGTHVAGTIAAIGNNEYGIKGIAPKVDLYAYRVLGAYGSGSTSGIIKAIDTAVIEGMDVINLSLGGGANSETDGGSFAINNAMLAGTISVIATGNSGPKRGTMGTPSTSRLGIAVANTTNPEAHFKGDATITIGDYNLSKTLNLMGTTFGQDLATQLNGNYGLIAVPGVGKPADYADVDVSGKVALVSRGEVAFVDKIAAAKDEGAIGIIVHNFAGGSNAPGPSGTFLGDAFEFIPTFDMSVTDGDAIRDALKQVEGTISFSNFEKTMTEGDDVNDSSSRGPSTPNFDIKPDVSAPGTNIMSTIPMYKADYPEASYEQAYTRKTGTSMATPHIAGIAALVKQANPSWNAFDVKVALSNTAKVLDTGKYDVFAQGAGRVQAYQAAHPEILAYAQDTANNDGETVENIKGTVTFGPQSLKEDVSVVKQIVVKNKNGSGGTYNATVEITKGFGDAAVTIDKPSFTLSGEETLNVTLTASANENPAPGSELLGYIHITGGSTTASLPFAADFGGDAAVELKDMSITETDLSFNGDGVKDEAVLYFTITGDVTANFLELWDIMDPEGGVYADGYIGYLHAGNTLGAGSYQLPVKGNYTPWEGTGSATIPDGLYTIDYSAQTVSGNPPVISDFVGPIVVKSEAGTIEGTVEGTTATGQIDDAYIAYQAKLVEYELGYDINTKLKATYEVIKEEEVITSGQVKLEQDGSFNFDVPTLTEEDSLKVKYEDASGNKAEEVIFVGSEIKTPVAIAPMAPVPSEPIPADNTYVKSFGLDNIAVSPNENGKGDTAKFSFEFKEKPSMFTYIDVFDAQNPKSGKYNDGVIGTVFKDSSAVIKNQGVFNGSYTDATTNKLEQLNEGVYGLNLWAFNSAYKMMGADIGPVFVKTTAPELVEVTIDEEHTISGSVNDKFIDFKPLVKTHFDKEYDLNTYVELVAVVENAAGVKTENKITLEQDGTFSATLEGVDGESSVTVFVQDIAQNMTKQVLEVMGEANTVTYTVNHEALALKVGESAELTVTETTTKPDGTKEEKDVTAEATFESADEKIATVTKGNVKAIAEGTTEIMITYGEIELPKVKVTVANPVITYPPYIPPVAEEKPEVEKPTPPVFNDIANTFAAKEINALVAKGIVQGKTTTEFAPNAQITRAEFAVLLARALDLPVKEYEGKFGDVNTSKKWAYAGVEAAARAGIVNGTQDGKFNPDAPIKREEIAAMVVRAIEYQNKEKLANLNTPANFTDHGSIGAFAIDSVYKAAALGVIKGNDGNFAPKNNATRAEATVMLYRALDALVMLD